MTGITALGIGSGLDINSIVSQLMAVENQPLGLLNQQLSADQVQLSAYGQIASSLSTLQTSARSMETAQNLLAFKTASSDPTTLSATATTNASTGTYNITVSQLAQAQTLTSVGQTSATTAIGSGSSTNVAITVGGATKNVTIDNTNNTLNGIAAAVNNASAGVSASVVNSGTSTSPNYQLMITGNNSGTANTMTISVTGDTTLQNMLSYPPGTGGGMTQLTAAQNAQFTVNGLSVTRASNSVSDVITGVTLSLLKVNTASTTLTVSNDSGSLTSALQNFVNGYNSLIKTTNGLIVNQPSSANSSTTNGPLAGDTTPTSILSGIQDTVTQYNSSAPMGYQSLSQIGITTQSDGTLGLDTNALTTAYNANPSAVTTLVSKIAQQTDSMVQNDVGTGGYISAMQNGLNGSIQDLQNQQTDTQSQLDQLKQQYVQQFSALDTMVSQMQATGNYLTQQLASIPYA